MSTGEQANVERFGYPYVGDQFRPHFTAAYGIRPPTGNFATYVEMAHKILERHAFRFRCLSLVELLENGCVGQEIATTSLSERTSYTKRPPHPQVG